MPGSPKAWATAPDPALPMKLIELDDVRVAVDAVLESLACPR